MKIKSLILKKDLNKSNFESYLTEIAILKSDEIIAHIVDDKKNQL